MSQSLGARQDRVRVSQACEQCREKKSKCDGVKPICGRCQVKDLECHYGVTKRIKNQQVMRELATKVAQYESILKKNIPGQQMMYQAEPSYAEQSATPSASMTSAAASTLSRTPPVTTTAAPHDTYSTVTSSPTTPSHPPSEISFAHDNTPKTQIDGWENDLQNLGGLPPRLILEQAVKLFIAGTDVLFTFFDGEELQTLFNSVYEQVPKPDSKIALTQLYAAAAVGCQYYPHEFSNTTRLAFVSRAKLGLEDCIEEAPFAAVRTIALLCIYFAFEKKVAALMYADMGLRLAQVNRQETVFHEPASTPWQRIFGSLVFLDGWLCSTTGHLPTFQNNDLHSLMVMVGNNHSSIHAVVQHEMIKVAVLSSSILQDVYHARFVSTKTIVSYKNRLQQWLLALPEYMRLDFLLNRDTNTKHLRPIFLVHLLYMTAVILVYRRVLVEFAKFGNKWSDPNLFQQSQMFLEPCLWTGRQVAKILDIALSQNLLTQKCWMFINCTYSACNVLLYFVASRLLHCDLSQELSHDIAATKQCIDVLTYCAELDESAARYLTTSSAVYDSLFKINENLTSLPTTTDKEQALTNQVDKLQEILSLTASFLIHPFDGGFRREVQKMQDVIASSVEDKPKSNPGNIEGEDVVMASPFTDRTTQEAAAYSFLNDYFWSKGFLEDRKQHGKGKESDKDIQGLPFTFFDGVVFGS